MIGVTDGTTCVGLLWLCIFHFTTKSIEWLKDWAAERLGECVDGSCTRLA